MDDCYLEEIEELSARIEEAEIEILDYEKCIERAKEMGEEEACIEFGCSSRKEMIELFTDEIRLLQKYIDGKIDEIDTVRNTANIDECNALIEENFYRF